MTSTLTWEPRRRVKNVLPTQIKLILRKRYGDPINVELSEEDIPYLEGIRDAGLVGTSEMIEELIKSIKKFGVIMLKEEDELWARSLP